MVERQFAHRGYTVVVRGPWRDVVVRGERYPSTGQNLLVVASGVMPIVTVWFLDSAASDATISRADGITIVLAHSTKMVVVQHGAWVAPDAV